MFRGHQPVIKAGVLIVDIHREEKYRPQYTDSHDKGNSQMPSAISFQLCHLRTPFYLFLARNIKRCANRIYFIYHRTRIICKSLISLKIDFVIVWNYRLI